MVSTTDDGNNIQLKRAQHDCSEHMKEILWKLATRQLKPTDWRRLALHWGFTDAHIRAIEHQYTGPHSYREHGYRLLLIWLHSVKKEENPMKVMFESLVAIGRKDLAESIRRKANLQGGVSKSPSQKFCLMS